MGNISQRLKLYHRFEIIRYKSRQLGLHGLLGLVLLLVSGFVYVVFITPKTQQLQQLQSAFSTLKARSASAVNNERRDPHFNHRHVDIVQQFYALLPIQNAANSKVSAVLSAAHRAGLATDKVEYSQSNASTTLVQYHIKLPLTGTYIQIRQFLNQVFHTLPSVALSELSLSRREVVSEQLDAHVEFTLYLTKPYLTKELQ